MEPPPEPERPSQPELNSSLTLRAATPISLTYTAPIGRSPAIKECVAMETAKMYVLLSPALGRNV